MDGINHGSEVQVVLQPIRLIPHPHELLYLGTLGCSIGRQSLACCIENINLFQIACCSVSIKVSWGSGPDVFVVGVGYLVRLSLDSILAKRARLSGCCTFEATGSNESI